MKRRSLLCLDRKLLNSFKKSAQNTNYQCLVVRKLISANPQLKVDQVFISCIKNDLKANANLKVLKGKKKVQVYTDL